MRISINGEWTEAPEGEMVSSLLARLGLEPGRVAVERNLAIVTKARFSSTALVEGDRIEIVHFVGGG